MSHAWNLWPNCWWQRLVNHGILRSYHVQKCYFVDFRRDISQNGNCDFTSFPRILMCSHLIHEWSVALLSYWTSNFGETVMPVIYIQKRVPPKITTNYFISQTVRIRSWNFGNIAMYTTIEEIWRSSACGFLKICGLDVDYYKPRIYVTTYMLPSVQH